MTNIKIINANDNRTNSTSASNNSIARNNRGYHAPWGPRGPKGPWVPPRAPKGPLDPPRGPEGAPGSLGPEALRAGEPEKTRNGIIALRVRFVAT